MIVFLTAFSLFLCIALWFSTMLLWWQTEQGLAAKHVNRQSVVYVWNKAARLARRSWYGSLRYSRQAVVWSNRKAGHAFVALFPKSKPAFAKQDPLTGLEHGPSSYYLATLSKPVKKTRKRKVVAETPEAELSEQE